MNKNFTFLEFVRSNNHPQLQAKELPISVAENIFNLWYYVIQPLRDAYGKPIIVTSGYRPEKLNNAVSGAKSSQHLTGQAVDIKASTIAESKRLGRMIEQMNLPFDQLIYEPTWIHVSYSSRHRKQVLHYD